MHDRVCPPRRMRFSFESRCRLVRRVLDGESPREAAAACGASRATGYRLWRRYREGGWAALLDRPPVPRHQPRRLSAAAEQEILEARAYANAGPVIVAGLLGRPASTVWKVLRRHGVSRLPQAPREPARRYERARPGERESPADCTAFLRRATAWYLDHGITIERVLTDNGNGYRSREWAATCTDLGIARRYTRPRRPQTNGKAEALVKTLLREWAYRFSYPTSRHRALALPGYLRWYNQHRPHSSLGGRPPISRVSQVRGTHT